MKDINFFDFWFIIKIFAKRFLIPDIRALSIYAISNLQIPLIALLWINALNIPGIYSDPCLVGISQLQLIHANRTKPWREIMFSAFFWPVLIIATKVKITILFYFRAWCWRTYGRHSQTTITAMKTIHNPILRSGVAAWLASHLSHFPKIGNGYTSFSQYKTWWSSIIKLVQLPQHFSFSTCSSSSAIFCSYGLVMPATYSTLCVCL